MKWFVQVTFDLRGAMNTEYEALAGWLNSIGLKKSIDGGDGKIIDLPFNSFANVPDWDKTAEESIAFVREQFELSAQWNSCEGKAFISVSPAETTERDVYQFGL